MIAVIADTHGNAHALEAVVADARRSGAERFLFLGDHFDGGPMPEETFSIMGSLESIGVLGNHDIDLMEYHAGWMPEWDECCLYDSIKWTYRHLTPPMFSYLGGIRDTFGFDDPTVGRIMFCHGVPGDPYASMPTTTREVARIMTDWNVSVLLSGHTHKQCMMETEKGLFLNPGSLGMARSGLAEYALLTLDGHRVSGDLRGIPYDMDGCMKAFHTSGLLEEGGICAKLNLFSIGSGTEHYFPYVGYALEYAKDLGINERSDIPDRVWWEAFHAYVGKGLWREMANRPPFQGDGTVLG